MPDSIIDRAYEDTASLLSYLSERNEVSLLRTVDDASRKTLVLSAASLFEHQISDAIQSYCARKSGSDACVIALIRNKAVKRQYSTYFDWDNGRPGPFFTLLGEEIGQRLKEEAKVDPLKSSVDAFLELGSLRNRLVHQNFAGYIFEKTNEEVYQLYQRACVFVDKVLQALA